MICIKMIGWTSSASSTHGELRRKEFPAPDIVPSVLGHRGAAPEASSFARPSTRGGGVSQAPLSARESVVWSRHSLGYVDELVVVVFPLIVSNAAVGQAMSLAPFFQRRTC
jgi:hypothetical protein